MPAVYQPIAIMLQFDITKLKEGDVLEEMATPSAEQLDLDPEQFSDIKVSVLIRKMKNRLIVEFDAAATARLQGDRTLRWYDQPLEGSFTITFKPINEITAEDKEDEAIKELPSGKTTVDISKEVRDTLMLTLPMRRVAPGAEEEEIQLEYGTSEEGTELDRPDWKRKLEQLREETDNE